MKFRSDFMDAMLQKRLKDIETHLQRLRTSEQEFLYLDAHKKVLASGLFLKYIGNSVAEKEAKAFSSQEWMDFSKGLVEAETKFNHERRIHELLLKRYDGEHLSLKIDGAAIKRQI